MKSSLEKSDGLFLF